MTLQDQIQKQISQLPPDKQTEVLDFIAFLLQRDSLSGRLRRRPLEKHPTFGLWRKRKIDPLKYQQAVRAEWDEHL